VACPGRQELGPLTGNHSFKESKVKAQEQLALATEFNFYDKPWPHDQLSQVFTVVSSQGNPQLPFQGKVGSLGSPNTQLRSLAKGRGSQV
jgi:hypothetical protein